MGTVSSVGVLGCAPRYQLGVGAVNTLSKTSTEGRVCAMVAPSTRHPASERTRGSRGRRVSRPSGDDRELAILRTAERLLAQRPLSEISIDDLAKGAGISRPTFYFYFRSKEAVLLTLLDRVVAEADRASEAIGASSAALGPVAGWRAVIATFYQAFSSHPELAIAATQLRARSAEARELWSSVMGKWVRRAADAIEAERARGAAPDGAPAEQLAAALVMMNERAMFATLSGEQPAIDAEQVVDVLLSVWLSSIYRTTDPG
jgi:AcrR family transcriptional regulator